MKVELIDYVMQDAVNHPESVGLWDDVVSPSNCLSHIHS